jgi:hypothetical protein
VLKYIDNTGGTLSEANNNTIDYADRLDKPRPRLPGVTEAERLGNFANHGYLALNFDTPLPSRRRKG